MATLVHPVTAELWLLPSRMEVITMCHQVQDCGVKCSVACWDSGQGRFFSFSIMTSVLILWGSSLMWNLPCLAVLVSTTWNQCCERSAYRTGASAGGLLQKFSAWYHLKARSRSSRLVPSWCNLHFPFRAFWVIFLCAGTWTPVHKHW